MIDDLDAVLDAQLQRLRIARMRRHPATVRSRDIAHGVDLGFGHDGAVGRRGRCAGIAGDVDLERVDAFAAHLAGKLSEALGAVEAWLRRRRAVATGEPLVEHAAGVASREQHVLFGRDETQLNRHSGVGKAQVRVRLDQARHQRGATAIDSNRVVADDGHANRRYRRDAVCFDQNLTRQPKGQRLQGPPRTARPLEGEGGAQPGGGRHSVKQPR